MTFTSNRGVQEGLAGVGHLLRVLLHWKWLALATALLVFGALAAVVISLESKYTATSMVVLEAPVAPQIAAPGTSTYNYSPPTDPFAVRSEVDIITSEAIALRIIDQLGLADEIEFAPEPPGALALFVDQLLGAEQQEPLDPERLAAERRGALLEEYRTGLTVFSDGRSRTVTISMESHDPFLSARIANAHARAYIALKSELAYGDAVGSIEKLRREIEKSAGSLEAAELAVQRFRNENGLLLDVTSRGMNLADAELSRLTELLVEAQENSASARNEIELFLNGDGAHSTKIASTPILAELLQTEARAIGAYNRATALFSSNDGTVSQARRELEWIRETIEDEKGRIRQRLEADLQAAQAREVQLRLGLDEATDAKKRMNEAQARLQALEARADAHRGIHAALLTQAETFRIEVDSPGARAVLVSPAEPPLLPSFPPSVLLILAATMVSGAAGVGAVFAAEKLVGRRHTAEEISEITGAAALATVGFHRKASPAAEPSPAAWQALRRLRLRLRAAAAGGETGDKQHICVTAPARGLAATQTAAGLARALAASGATTIIVDADPEGGLAEALPNGPVLRGTAPAGAYPHVLAIASSAEAPGSEPFAERIRGLATQYRAIVVRAAPLDVSSDALSLAEEGFQTLLAIPRTRSATGAVQRAQRLFAQAGVALAGFVLVEREHRVPVRQTPVLPPDPQDAAAGPKAAAEKTTLYVARR